MLLARAIKTIESGRLILMLAVSLASQTVYANQRAALPAGKVIERVVCQRNPAYSYSLYLPSRYLPEKKWPIIYCFDPEGRGSVPVGLFKAGAETAGFILAGSNDSRNGPGAPLEGIIEELWIDTHARFAIDEKQVYTAGFSGGGRVAIAIGFSKNAGVAGVIGVCAGFPNGQAPGSPVPFAFFGVTGTEDFNYAEMFKTASTLDRQGIPNQLEVFEGRHGWPPMDICTEAIEWMAVQAIRGGRREHDAALVKELASTLESRASAFQASSNTLEAYRSYEALAKNLTGLIDVSNFEKKAAELKDSPAFKQSVKEQKEELAKQEKFELSLLSLMRAAIGASTGPVASDNPTIRGGVPGAAPGSARPEDRGDLEDDREARLTAFSDLRRTINDLKKKSESVALSPDKWAAARALSGFLVGCLESSDTLKAAGQYRLAITKMELASEMRPKSSGIFYSLAGLYALAGDRSKALAALKRAVENGWTDVAAIEGNSDLNNIRTEEGYETLVESIKRKK
ncbi:MAG TPA: hypothetical protein VJX67_19445 [Blastocatellia bacterium]|nr:hypothetical protein [Blastocatellia bacterium]